MELFFVFFFCFVFVFIFFLNLDLLEATLVDSVSFPSHLKSICYIALKKQQLTSLVIYQSIFKSQSTLNYVGYHVCNVCHYMIIFPCQLTILHD